MKRKIELLAPGGDIESIKAAILAGADAIYCGLSRFNARNRATNIDFDDLHGIIKLAHSNNCSVFLTLNIIIAGSEIPAIVRLLNKLINTNIDGVIIQDLGLFYLLSTYFKDLKIHASTQLTTHNKGQIAFLHKLNTTRVNLSRELNIHEIKALTITGHKHEISTEIFVHGSYCLSFSGICYMSSVHGGNSGNRGRCSQPCRDKYLTTPEGINFPLNLKDNSAYFDLREISDAEVDSIKIEGRIKKFDYVYTVVNCWKKQLQSFYNHKRLINDNRDLYKVFNRDFTNSFLKGEIHKNMFIDNPMDHSIKQFSKVNEYSGNKQLLNSKKKYYEEKERISSYVKNKIKNLSIAKTPLTIRISGKSGTPLRVSVSTPESSFFVLSKTNLAHADTYSLRHTYEKKNKQSNANSLNYVNLLERLKALNDTGYFIKHLDIEELQSDLFISFNEFTSMKKKLLSILTGTKKIFDPIDVPFLKKQHPFDIKPSLSVLISSQKDVYLSNTTSASVFFQLPNCFENGASEFIDLFLKNKKLIPWFPSVIIGENYTSAVELLRQIHPELIVTNNTGIAYEASKKGIPWIAGPYMNIVNSFSLLCLKEKFNCYGSFISNEISRRQIKSIIKPDNFKLYYSIYHPVILLTSRQCLFHQVTGCDKSSMDEACIHLCQKSSSITNLRNVSFFIEKSKGNYHCLYNDTNFLNTEIVTDFPDFFSGFFIDLRDIKTDTKIKMDKPQIIKLFENFLNGSHDSKNKLKQIIYPSTNTQYKKGI